MRKVTSPSSVVSPARTPSSVLERVDDALRADERAREVRAHLDEVLADRLEVVHVVERRDRVAVGRRQAERVGDLAERLRRQPAVLLLREPKRRQRRRARVREARRASRWTSSYEARSPVDLAHHGVERADDRDHVGDQRVGHARRRRLERDERRRAELDPPRLRAAVGDDVAAELAARRLDRRRRPRPRGRGSPR